MSELSKLLQEAQDSKPMSARRRAEAIEGRLHHGTISAYLRGSHPERPDEATLQALSEAFELPLDRVQKAAGVPVGAGPYVPPAEAARLTRRQQAAVTEIIMAMVESEGVQPWVAGKPGSEEPEPPRRGNVHELSSKHQRMVEDAMPLEEAAYTVTLEQRLAELEQRFLHGELTAEEYQMAKDELLNGGR